MIYIECNIWKWMNGIIKDKTITRILIFQKRFLKPIEIISLLKRPNKFWQKSFLDDFVLILNFYLINLIIFNLMSELQKILEARRKKLGNPLIKNKIYRNRVNRRKSRANRTHPKDKAICFAMWQVPNKISDFPPCLE